MLGLVENILEEFKNDPEVLALQKNSTERPCPECNRRPEVGQVRLQKHSTRVWGLAVFYRVCKCGTMGITVEAAKADVGNQG